MGKVLIATVGANCHGLTSRAEEKEDFPGDDPSRGKDLVHRFRRPKFIIIPERSDYFC